MQAKEGIKNIACSTEDHNSGTLTEGLNSLHAKDKTISFASLTGDYESGRFKIKPSKSKRRLEWDEQLPDSIKQEFQEWIDDIPEVA